MTDIEIFESVFKTFGISGVLFWIGFKAIQTFAPIWREHLRETAQTMKIVAQSMQEMIHWQRTIDLRLSRVEDLADEGVDNIRILYERQGEPLPKRRRTDTKPRSPEVPHETT